MAQKRIYYAVKAVYIADCGDTTFTKLHGVQSCGVNTKYNLEQVFQLGESAIYENQENVPDVEITLEKVLDGYPLIYHHATHNSPASTLTGRSNAKCTVGIALFSDQQDSASGTPVARCVMSGVYVSQLNYNFQVQGNSTESVTLVGNNKVWNNNFTIQAFNNNDSPLALSGSGGVNRREDFLLGSGNTKLPSQIPGVDSVTNYLYENSDGFYDTPLQSVKVSANLGREALYELGRKGAFHRYVQFPVEVKCDIEVLSTSGDQIQALEEADNLVDQTIFIKMREGTWIDLGTKNKIQSVTMGGANAGGQGGNENNVYSFVTYNQLDVKHPQDPTAALRN